MKTKDLIKLIREEGLENEFFRIAMEYFDGDMNRDIDESYSGGFWDFTYDLGLDCDTAENEKVFESVYNKLWKIVETMKEGK